MKSKLLLQAIAMSRLLFYGIFLQACLSSLLIASGSMGQNKQKPLDDIIISVDLRDTPLTHAFAEITDKTNLRFAYDKNAISADSRITANMQNSSLTRVLKEISKKADLKFKRINENIFVSTKDILLKPSIEEVIAKEKFLEITVSGKVISSEDNEGIPGVNVIIKSTNTGTVTDIDGNFSLEVPGEESVLIFSSVGFTTQEVTVGTQSVINVTMDEDVTSLDEIVVVGYGEQKKVNLTGAVGSIDGSELVKRPVANPANLLQGKIPGVQISQAFAKPGDERNTIRIRGAGTFSSAGSDPLVLINGIAGDMTNLNPDDIESVSVLKDAASSAIYGARAANGVILVTTKKGKGESISVQYHGNVQAHQATRLPELLTNSADYMMYWNQGRIRGGNVPYFSQETIDAFRNNPNDPVNYPNFDWIDHSFRTGFAQNHYVNVSGGNGKSFFNAAIGYLDQDGITSTYEYQKYTGLLSFSSEIKDWITIGGEIQFVKKDITKSNWDNDVDYQILAIYGAAPNYTPTMTLPDGTTGYVARYSSSIGEWTVRNPDAQDASGLYTQNDYNVVPQAFVDIKLLEGLSWNTKVAFSLFDTYNKGHEHAVDNYFFEDGSYAHNNSTWRLGVTDVNRQTTLTTLFSTLSYNKIFNEDHGLDILAGYNQESFNERELRGSRINFPTNDIKELNAGATEGQTNYGTASEWAIQSLFGRIAYNFKSKYLFEVNARYDGTSRISPDTRWGFFPSVSAGWRISEEGFVRQINWLENLKLRASWGQLGNQNVGLYPYQEVLSTTSYPFGSTADPGVRQTRMVDPTLQWETTTMTDIGLDVGIRNGLFTATIDWYDKVTDDILYNIPVPASIGLSAPTVNYGKMRNRGYEIELGHGQQLGEFNYNVFFNYSHNENEVLRILAPSYGNTTIQEGLPFNSFYLTEWIGIFQSQEEIDEGPLHPFNPKPGDLKFKDQNGDNKIDADDRIVVDGAYPKFIYGGGLNLSWRNFSLSAFFQGVKGQKLSVQGLAWGLVPYIQGSPPPMDFIENMWTPENPTNEHPAMYVSGYAPVTGTRNTYWLLDASYLRLKNLSVEYNIPDAFIQRVGLDDLRVYVSGDNLFTITDYPGADPERASTGWFEAYPQVRIFTLGVRVKL